MLGAQAEAQNGKPPLSAIDWLSQSLVTPAALPVPTEPPVASSGTVPDAVTVQTLGADTTDSLGVLAPGVTGLPQNLWGPAQIGDILHLLAQDNRQDLPALQGLLITLLLAEADPPAGMPPGETLFLARVDKLMEIGALDQARALLDAAGATRSPEIFRRYFDVSLLIGDEDKACAALKTAPGLAPALPTRIFCLARAGDFDTAELTLDTSKALGTVSPDEAALLARFMNPELDDTGITPIMPNPVTPLIFRIYEAIGEPLPDTTLPVAFTYADLSDRAGWKAQLDAVERLARAGAVAPNMLLGLYTDQKPAASGGVWDRVAAFQAFDAAVTARDAKAVARTLPPAWTMMQQAELEVPFATLFGPALAKMKLSGDTARLAREVMLLSPDYAKLTKGLQSSDPKVGFLLAVARGTVADVPPLDDLGAAIAAAFKTPAVPTALQPLIDQHRTGEAILQAMQILHQGEAGDLRAVTEGLSTLRAVGLDDVARRTALQMMLLDRRG
ncbi:hypothetical protein GC209_15265 [bacterium]|nr:hypothetical protein [bacterium]